MCAILHHKFLRCPNHLPLYNGTPKGAPLSQIHHHRLPQMSKLFVLEALLPLGIIAGMLCIAGNVQYQIHKAATGRPKHIGNDVWDVAMERRDKKLVDKYYPAEAN